MQVAALKMLAEKNASMMWQVEGYRNETELVKQHYDMEIQQRDQSVSVSIGSTYEVMYGSGFGFLVKFKACSIRILKRIYN